MTPVPELSRDVEWLGLRVTEHAVDGLYVREFQSELGTELGEIVMVPGGFHGAWAFDPWMPLLAAEGWRCLAVSLRGHSGSATLTDDAWVSLTIWDYLEDLEAVLHWVGGRPVLLGHSMGGLVAQMAASQAKALVLVCSVGPGQFGPLRDPFPTDRPLQVSLDQARQLWFRTTPSDVLERVYEKLGVESPSALNSYSDGSVHLTPGACAGPVLAIGAELDGTPVPPAAELAKFYCAEWFEVAGCGHELMFEPSSMDVARAIGHWLRTRVVEFPTGAPWRSSSA